MKKSLSLFLVLILVTGMLSVTALAAEEPAFRFELSVDGNESKQVKTGDIITVVLWLKRTDAADQYTMYAMQDEIRYDSDFFELVEGSAVLSNGIASTDIGMRDNFREFYMNFLSTSGGATWDADTLVGSFQLRVIATSGVTKITNQDYLVSTKDGSGSFECSANELTIILTTECTVHFESNGGSDVPDQTVQYGELIEKPEDPTREGYIFEGWYKNLDKTEKWDFENDTVTGSLTLYAAWTMVSDSPDDIPSCGDSSQLSLYATLGLLALLLILFLLPRKKVVFNTMGGSELEPKRVLKNTKLKMPESVQKHGMVFVGWYRDEDCMTPWNFDEDKVTEDITLYAKWL
jgi:uncharacterized repeat protein (TIGR02543 family)